MRLGFSLPIFGRTGTEPGGIARFAQAAEAAGAASLWVGDRLLSPVNPVIGYGGTNTMPDLFRVSPDPLTALTLAAAVTKTATLGSATLNATQYQPVALARTLTTIDVASNGRLLPGFGLGWSPDEYAAVGVPFEGRGKRLDDVLDLLDAWWSTSPVAHNGIGYTVPSSHVELKPVRTPPVHLAAFTPRGFRRVAERAAGWLPLWTIPEQAPLDTLTQNLATIRAAAETAGRDPDTIQVALRLNPTPGVSVETIAEHVHKTVPALGADETHVDLHMLSSTVDEAIDLAGQVLELVNKG